MGCTVVTFWVTIWKLVTHSDGGDAGTRLVGHTLSGRSSIRPVGQISTGGSNIDWWVD